MLKQNYDLVQCITSDNLILSGLLTEGDKSKPLNIIIHGFTSDFYAHLFPNKIASKLKESNNASIIIQTRGTGLHTEFILGDRSDGKFIGSFYEKLEEAHIDISAWIKFGLEAGYKSFNLIGHSLGTIKSVRYIFEGEYKDLINKLVLLAPFDKNGYIVRKVGDKLTEYLNIADQKISKGKGEEIVTDDMEDYPVTYITYKSWYSQDDLGFMWDFYRIGTYNFPIISNIQIPVKIIVGDQDEYFYIPEFNNLAQVENLLKEKIQKLDLSILNGSKHTYVGFEDQVSNLTSTFINE